jgi:hypothetical protein
MIDGAIFSSGGAFFAVEAEAAARWTDLTQFERCVAACAAWGARTG